MQLPIKNSFSFDGEIYRIIPTNNPDVEILICERGAEILRQSVGDRRNSIFVVKSSIGSFYAKTTVSGETVFLHRLFCSLQRGDHRVVDHKNGLSLDNRISNLEVTSQSENIRRASKGSIFYHKKTRKWEVRFKVGNHKLSLGYYHSEFEAQKISDAARIFTGTTTSLFFPDEKPIELPEKLKQKIRKAQAENTEEIWVYELLINNQFLKIGSTRNLKCRINNLKHELRPILGEAIEIVIQKLHRTTHQARYDLEKKILDKTRKKKFAAASFGREFFVL